MGMVPWRLYQEIATDMRIPAETMQQVNILADGWYLTSGVPPFLQYDIPSQFGAGGSWLEANPKDAVEFCKAEYGSDAATAAILRCVGNEVLKNTDSELETSFTLLAADIDEYLSTIANAQISPEVKKVQSYFDDNKVKLQDFRKTHDSEEPPQKYCDSCGAGIYEPFQYRCEECSARFPGWAALTYAEGEQQSTDAWREQMDVKIVTQNRHRHFVVLEADESLPGWIEEGGKVGQITDDGLTDLGKVVHTESRTTQVDHDTAAAAGLVEGQQITICSSESNIGTTQQLGLIHEIRQDFAKWRSTADPAPVVAKLLSTAPTLIDTLDQPTLNRPTEQAPTDTDSLAGFPLDTSQTTVLKEICGLQPGELSLIVGPPGSGK
ncbi:AAA family ATPase, partial [Halorubrum ezzemoulense]|nr:AAA family ATPase [Halorubrum ezzemoulense]